MLIASSRRLKFNPKQVCFVRNSSFTERLEKSTFWKWTTSTRPHWKESPKEAAIMFTVFGITGSSSMLIVRPMLNKCGLEGNWVDGPWSYRIGSLVFVSPIYASILITLGTLSGRHLFFATMGKKIIGRFFPSKFREKIACNPAIQKKAKPKT